MKANIVKTEEYKFIRGFTKISISGICKRLNISRCNIISGQGKASNFKLVKRELEKEIAKLYLGDDKDE